MEVPFFRPPRRISSPAPYPSVTPKPIFPESSGQSSFPFSQNIKRSRRESRADGDPSPDADSQLLEQDALLQALLGLQDSGGAHRVHVRQHQAPLGGRLVPSQVAQDQLGQRVSLEEQVRSAMRQVLNENPELGAAFEQFVSTPSGSESEIEEEVRNNDLVANIQAEALSEVPKSSAHILSPPPPAEPEVPVPTVTIKELEAEPGCRSFSTTTCTKLPVGETTDTAEV